MATHWGVDSANPANHMIESQTLFAVIKQKAGQAPAFWGRYIGGRSALTAGEVEFLHGANSKILVIYNGALDNSTSVRGGFHEGVNDANRAIAAAQALGVPGGTWIYADIEASWRPTPEWFKGWSKTMHNSHFGGAGGVYCNPSPANSANFNAPYCAAFNSEPTMQGQGTHAAYVFSSEPERRDGCTTAAEAPAFAPDNPPCNPNTVIWQYAENCFGGLVDEDLADDAGFASMW